MPADAGRWALDLSAAGLWSQLNHWGRTGKLLSVSCDESKPLKSIAGEFTGVGSVWDSRDGYRGHSAPSR